MDLGLSTLPLDTIMNDPQKDAFLKELKDEYHSSEDQKRRQEQDQHNKKSVSDSDPDPHSHADSDIYLDLYSSEIQMHMIRIADHGSRTSDLGRRTSGSWGVLQSSFPTLLGFFAGVIRVLCRGNFSLIVP